MVEEETNFDERSLSHRFLSCAVHPAAALKLHVAFWFPAVPCLHFWLSCETH